MSKFSFWIFGVRNDLLDGQCSQPVLDEAAVLELVDDEVVAVLLVLLHADDGVVLPELLYDDVADAQFESLDAVDEPVVVGLDMGCQCQPVPLFFFFFFFFFFFRPFLMPFFKMLMM